jgi:hypothetical protein
VFDDSGKSMGCAGMEMEGLVALPVLGDDTGRIETLLVLYLLSPFSSGRFVHCRWNERDR